MMLAEDRKGLTRVDAVHEMLDEYPLFNEYWQTKCPNFSKVTVPAYVVGSYTNLLHVAGTSRAFRAIASQEKWLRIHNSHEWSDIIASAPDLMRFFDHYLKGKDNGWEQTPRVRLSILDPGGEDTVDQAENEWPLARTQYTKLYLDAGDMTMKDSLS